MCVLPGIQSYFTPSFPFFFFLSYSSLLYEFTAYAVFIGLTPEQGALILGLTNGAAFAGRIVLGLLADRFSNSVIMLISTWSTAISVVVFWSVAKSFATLTIMGMSFGFFVGKRKLTTTATLVVRMDKYVATDI